MSEFLRTPSITTRSLVSAGLISLIATMGCSSDSDLESKVKTLAGSPSELVGEEAYEEARQTLRPTDMTPWTRWGVDAEDLISVEDLDVGDTFCTVGTVNGFEDGVYATGEYTVTAPIRDIEDLAGYPDFLRDEQISFIIPVEEVAEPIEHQDIRMAPYVFASSQGLDNDFLGDDEFNPIYRSFSGPCPK